MYRTTWARCIAGLVVLTVGAPAMRSLAAVKPCASSRFRSAKPLVIAHASSTYFGPGNTLAMMRAARAAGADVMDADVRITSDGVLVAAHDDDLQHVTNGTGSLAKTTFAALRTLDAAWTWKDPKGRFALRGKGVVVPTIAEILAAFPGRRISLEFKVTGGEQALCDLLRSTKRTGDIYVSSAGDAAIDTFKPLCPEVVTTVTDALVPVMQEARRTGESWCSPVPIGQPPYYRAKSFLTKDSIAWSHAHGLAVYTWTVDDPKDLRSLATSGVDGVYTGRADLARRIFDAPRR
jgi:glycerophosphoryl diester phosphodiesterase